MRLKSLEMKGFKSFADKTRINFNEDVIGVVGSNGCGKSNIVDAIRWVLGEQKTSQLRSDSMTNVIFNGTKQRKASGMAEVCLVFENDKGILPTEYGEVAIKRILYQDGSSEYRLNEVKCRLKDIQNLLADTGISSDSYAIIALGMVDELLQDKDNARSKLFEQAAGISKYKVRKKETLNKLKHTDEDLNRVEDLLEEMDKNLKVLERQAKRAKKYLEIKEEYRKLSLAWFVYRLDTQKKQYHNLEGQIQTETAKAKQLEQDTAKLEKALEQAKAGHIHLEEALQKRQQELNRLVGRIKNQENELKMRQQKNLFIEENNRRLNQNLDTALERFDKLQADQARYAEQVLIDEERLAEQQEDLDRAKIEADTLRNRHGQVKAELDDYLRRQQRQQNLIFELERKTAIQQGQIENSRQRIKHLEQQLEERRQASVELQTRAQSLQNQVTEAEQALAELRQKETERQENLQNEEEILRQSQEDLREHTRELDAKQNEYKLLKGLVESLEGFSESIKFLNKNRSWSANAPLLSDLFYCKPEYRKALENYLEGYLGYYVVQNIEEALQAIALLEQHQKGKANFFVLDYLPKTPIKPAQAYPQGAVPALSVLDIEPQYQALAEQLLAEVLIVDKVEDIPAQDPHFTWLTIDGKRSQKAASLRGGSGGAFEGKTLGRKKNLERLGEQIAALTAKVEQGKQEEQRHRLRCQELRQQNFQTAIRNQEQNLQNLLRQHIQIKGQWEQFEQFVLDNTRQREQLQAQIGEQEGQIATWQSELRDMQEALLDLQEEVADKDSNFRVLAEALSRAGSTYNQKNIELLRQQNKLASGQKELQFIEKQLQELIHQQQQDQVALNSGQEELQRSAEEMTAIERQLQEDYEDRRTAQGFLAEAEKNYLKAREGIQDHELNLRQQQRLEQQQMQLLHQLQQQFTEVKLQLTHIGERLQAEFEIEMKTLLNEQPDPQYQEAELQEQVEDLRKKLQNFGPVNPMALESYEELLQRFEFIQQQRQDLLESKETLLQTMSEIEEKATTRFMEAFTQVRSHFIEVFRSLFMEDDTCDLVLVQPDRPLESAIDIVAKPKGKRPLSINQLSGGEKTLTATALLFSLYLLKPAPFCIFDEVDAPLDDANIAKFNNIIREFSKNSQFIIVTHNKKTMEAVNTMYGVTMIQGVSKVVPVDFRALAELEVD